MRRKKKCILAARTGWRKGINEEEICVHSQGLKRGWTIPPWMYLLIKREKILNTLRLKGCQIFYYMKIRKKMWRNNSLEDCVAVEELSGVSRKGAQEAIVGETMRGTQKYLLDESNQTHSVVSPKHIVLADI